MCVNGVYSLFRTFCLFLRDGNAPRSSMPLFWKDLEDGKFMDGEVLGSIGG